MTENWRNKKGNKAKIGEASMQVYKVCKVCKVCSCM